MIELRFTLFTAGFILLFIVIFMTMMKRRDNSDHRKTTFVRTFLKAGAPDQLDEIEIADLENNKMVSEGSQFGVQYFNKFMHD